MQIKEKTAQGRLITVSYDPGIRDDFHEMLIRHEGARPQTDNKALNEMFDPQIDLKMQAFDIGYFFAYWKAALIVNEYSPAKKLQRNTEFLRLKREVEATDPNNPPPEPEIEISTQAYTLNDRLKENFSAADGWVGFTRALIEALGDDIPNIKSRIAEHQEALRLHEQAAQRHPQALEALESYRTQFLSERQESRQQDLRVLKSLCMTWADAAKSDPDISFEFFEVEIDGEFIPDLHLEGCSARDCLSVESLHPHSLNRELRLPS